MSATALQLGTQPRARRWAVMRITLDAMLKAAMPMLRIRVKVVGASLVCRVESTKWPGLRCLDGDIGRFQVADLTHHDDVGVLAQERFEAAAKVNPAFSFTLTWLTPGRLISDGIFRRGDVDPGWLSRFRQV